MVRYHNKVLTGELIVTALSKPIKRQLREWSAVAYERELGAELKNLHDAFHDWEQGKMSCFDLTELIHVFHDKSARELYKTYVMLGNERIEVRVALARGVLSEHELPEEVLKWVRDE
jgi:hypothetical protein